ncbi:MAG: sorbitol-6-phosphate dehydrogenase subunit [Candidatus Omnitrophica bacterium]|nr:sorbitol-6-phosphate dehydrogenase subunit [Candidatus Omnitrophota bacterium]MCM8777938.1 sorbitol-6-phosphate dehydrogenase subunit [Candidatus Omnitrophota bacterium]
MVEINLKGRAGIITGSASGIGKAVVEKLLQCGAGVVISDINEKQGLSVEEGFKKKYGNVLFVKTDVTRRKDIEEMVIITKKQYGRIDFLVNNAGILIPRLLVDPAGKEEITEEIFEKITGINQKGAVFCAQAVAREMIKDKIKGVIVNVSSESGLEGSEGQSIYAGTKAAMYSFTRSWAKELGRYGIRVVGIAPGILEPTALRTPEYERALAYTRGITVEQLRQSYEKVSIPLGRVGTLEEVANVVAFLISDLASYITGTVINISGGKSRG